MVSNRTIRNALLGAGMLYIKDRTLGRGGLTQLKEQLGCIRENFNDLVENVVEDFQEKRELVTEEINSYLGNNSKKGPQKLAGDNKLSTDKFLARAFGSNWGYSSRTLIGLTGGLLALRGFRQGLGGVLKSIVGVGLVSQCLSTKDVKRFFAIDESPRRERIASSKMSRKERYDKNADESDEYAAH